MDKIPKTLKWHYETKQFPETFYVDNGLLAGLHDINDGKPKYGWILESRIISQPYINHIKENFQAYKNTYKYIFTHYKELLNLDPDLFKWTPAYGTYIDDFGIHKKSKLCSMIASRKTFSSQQVLRIQVAEALDSCNQVDVFGRDTNPIDKIEEGLKDYMFSIAIENDSYETYFTEKIIDCFAVGTVPVYMGAPDIGNHFNCDGIIKFEPGFDMNILTPELYESMEDAIRDNYNRSLKLDILDDWIYNTYINI